MGLQTGQRNRVRSGFLRTHNSHIVRIHQLAYYHMYDLPTRSFLRKKSSINRIFFARISTGFSRPSNSRILDRAWQMHSNVSTPRRTPHPPIYIVYLGLLDVVVLLLLHPVAILGGLAQPVLLSPTAADNAELHQSRYTDQLSIHMPTWHTGHKRGTHLSLSISSTSSSRSWRRLRTCDIHHRR